MEERKAGVCGRNVTWDYDEKTHKLTISGVGPMADYVKNGFAPWYDLREEISEIKVKEGITKVGDYAFFKCVNATAISIPSTADMLGYHSIGTCTSLREVVLPEGVRVLESRTFDACSALERIYLPLSLKAIDMKCFPECDALKEVVYAGTEESWNRIRLSTVGDGNTLLYTAPRRYEGKIAENESVDEDERIWFREKKEVVPVLDMAREILKQGGDGRLHILAFENRLTKVVHEKSGDASLVIFPNGQTMMIDAGVPGAREKMMKALKRLELTSLDHFVTSHCHHDHIGNALPVVQYLYEQGGKVGTYHYVDLQYGTWEPPLSDYLREQGTEMLTNTLRGDEMSIGGVKIDILGPTKKLLDDFKRIEGGVNSVSIVMKFIYGKSSYLTGGDLFRSVERQYVEEVGDRLKADILKANHHGIVTSTADEWLDAVDPEVVVGHHDDIASTSTAEKIRARGKTYLTTGLSGAILMSLSADGAIDVVTEYGDRFSREGEAE